MSQTNVNTGGSGGGTVYTTDRSGTGFGMGMIMSMLIGLLLLALVAWWAITQSGWFGPMAGSGGSTNVNVTTNQPSQPSGNTGSTTGGSTTGGSTTGSTAGR